MNQAFSRQLIVIISFLAFVWGVGLPSSWAGAQGIDSNSPAPTGPLASFRKKSVQDFPLRSIGKLQITNRHGSVSVKGWSQDKIRVTMIKTIQAINQSEADASFEQIGLLQRGRSDHFELIAQLGHGVKIEDRQLDAPSSKVHIEMIVQAPAKLSLQVWGLIEPVEVKNWNSPVEVRTDSGPIHISEIRGKAVRATCISCGMEIRDLRGSLKCLGGTGDIKISDISGGPVYCETASGAINIQRIKGAQLYVTQGGAILGKSLSGRLEFQTKSGRVDLSQASGFASGSTTSGDVRIEMARWNFLDRAIFESELGQISLKLPSDFSGNVDLQSEKGKTKLEFPLRISRDDEESLKESSNRLKGVVGENAKDYLTVYSKLGNVKVLKGI